MDLTILIGIKEWFPKLRVKMLQETKFRENTLEEWPKQETNLNSKGKSLMPVVSFAQNRFSS
jgi:hypothetical protein